MVRSLALALEARDGYTGEHSDEVHELAVAVAGRLGLDARQIAEVSRSRCSTTSARSASPTASCTSPAALDGDEWALMREHPVIGERILRPLPGLRRRRHRRAPRARALGRPRLPRRPRGRGHPARLAGRARLRRLARARLRPPYRRALPRRRRARRARARRRLPVRPARRGRADRLHRRPGGADAPPAATSPALPSAGDEDQRLQPRAARADVAVRGGRRHELARRRCSSPPPRRRCRALDAGSLSISRWEAQRRGPAHAGQRRRARAGEERHPSDEIYRLDDDPAQAAAARAGAPTSASSTTRPAPDRARSCSSARQALGRPCRSCSPTSPGASCGRAAAASEPVFDEHDLRFLQTRSPARSPPASAAPSCSARVAELALEDGLTGLANRRALDERLERSRSRPSTSGTS